MAGADDWVVLPDGQTVPKHSRAARAVREEGRQSFADMVNEQRRDMIVAALATRGPVTEEDRGRAALFGRRWTDAEVTTVCEWLRRPVTRA